MDGSAKQANKRLLTTIIPFNYTNVSLKCLQMYKTDQRSGKNHRHLFNGSPLGGESQRIRMIHGFTEIAPPRGEPLKFRNV